MKLTSYLKKSIAPLSAAWLMSMVFISEAVASGLPKMEPPSKGEGAGFIETIKNYFFDFITLVALGLSAYALISVAYSAIETYGNLKTKKATLGELATTIGIGVLLIILTIWLGTKASDIFG